MPDSSAPRPDEASRRDTGSRRPEPPGDGRGEGERPTRRRTGPSRPGAPPGDDQGGGERPTRRRTGPRRRNPERTRSAILDAAEALVLEHGFGATTVEAIIEGAGVTKGAFFHHFESKKALGRALVERYDARDEAFLRAAVEQAERSYADPLQRVLCFVALFEEEMESLVEPFPGCLFASYSYQAELFDADTMDVVHGAMIRWRKRFGEMLEAAARRHPPRGRPDVEALADMLTVVLEGAFILSRTLDEPQAVARQLAHFRRYLELLFDPA